MILALVEENENGEVYGKPVKVYARNQTVTVTDSYFKKSKKLLENEKKTPVIVRNRELQLKDNFEYVRKLGFVHRSELEELMEQKLIEFENRAKINYWTERLITRPLKRMAVLFGFNVVRQIFKSIKNGN